MLRIRQNFTFIHDQIVNHFDFRFTSKVFGEHFSLKKYLNDGRNRYVEYKNDGSPVFAHPSKTALL